MKNKRDLFEILAISAVTIMIVFHMQMIVGGDKKSQKNKKEETSANTKVNLDTLGRDTLHFSDAIKQIVNKKHTKQK